MLSDSIVKVGCDIFCTSTYSASIVKLLSVDKTFTPLIDIVLRLGVEMLNLSFTRNIESSTANLISSIHNSEGVLMIGDDSVNSCGTIISNFVVPICIFLSVIGVKTTSFILI